MTVSRQKQLAQEDNLRAALLAMVHAHLGDSYLELMDGASLAPEQCLDVSAWLSETDKKDGREDELNAAVREFQAKLKALGLRGLLFVASEFALLTELERIRDRLYGDLKDSRH